ncbi:ketopantoate reductase family protein [Alsobacter sp. R-9]
MRICIYGAGAVGGHMAARLVASSGATVSVVARGAHLAAIQESGIWVSSGGTEIGGRPAAATDDPSSLPPQDVVVVTLKAHDATAAAPALGRLLKPDGTAAFFANGIPWWWRVGQDDPAPLEAVDPGGGLWRHVGPERVLGGVIYSGNQMDRPGRILHRGGDRWPVGEPDGRISNRVEALASLLKRIGLNAFATPDIRREVLVKLARNVAGNPISALTRLPGWTNHPETGIADVGRRMVEELTAVGLALGLDIRADVDPAAMVRPEGRVGGKSSMLQDVEAGRPLETEAILGQLQAFGRELGVPTPTIDVVAGLLRCLDLSIREARGLA